MRIYFPASMDYAAVIKWLNDRGHTTFTFVDGRLWTIRYRGNATTRVAFLLN